MSYLKRLSRFLDAHRRLVAMLIYGGLTAVSYATAYLLRFEFSVPRNHISGFLWTVGLLVVIRTAAFRAFHLTRERWRYAGARDAGRLLGACIAGSTIFFLLLELVSQEVRIVPISVMGMEGILTGALISGAWLAYRLSFEHLRRGAQGTERRVVIIGAGDAGNMLAREMHRTPTGYVPVAFVDDNVRMRGATVQGVDVLGSTAEMKAIAEDVHADELIIALPSAQPGDLRRVVSRCENTGLPFKVLPGIAEVVAGNVTLQQLREVRIEDLLGREPIELELPELAEDLGNATVLITGAAGSIGSELARQVALHRPARLILLDQAESDLFYLDLDLRDRHPGVNVVPLVADIVDGPRVEQVFSEHRPDRVFHAAAYKHVPMMECNAREAVRNNVIGTWRVADAAGRWGAGRFVLVSTDKAVNPTNVMGATKRLAELVVLDLQQRHPRTTYGAVRFGNVLGSKGSVLPLFRRQLREGKPLTVTHPDATRYFMTIPEAVQLILQASILADFRGHVAMLEMGDPVRIRDLAVNLLRLAGVPDPESRLSYIGLRPGEKLHEELVAPDEETQPTPVAKVRLLRSPASKTVTAVAEQVGKWDAAARHGLDAPMLTGFCELFPLLHPDALIPAVVHAAPRATSAIVALRIER
jgi:FlaA1/EpsC-like NDP-sugar epimerase